MAELIELEEVRLHAVIFKMRGDDIAVRIVRRVLHGAEIRDVHVLRDDNEAAGVLTGGALDADAAVGEAVLLRLWNVQPALLGVLENIAVSSLFREGADRAGAEDVVGAEELLGVFMRAALILAGEVQVDIGHFVASEAEEGLKRDIEALLLHLRAALSNGISKPSFFISVPHSGQSLSGMSAPQP